MDKIVKIAHVICAFHNATRNAAKKKNVMIQAAIIKISLDGLS